MIFKMYIYLIRHGESFEPAIEHYDTAKGTINPPLTDMGLRQADRLALRCKDIGFDAVISSDLTRAVQTAEKIAVAVSCELSVNSAFREIDMGDIYTKSWTDFPDIYAQWALHNEDIPYPNGENGEAVWSRCRGEIEKIVTAGYDRIAIVCHGGTIRSVICGVLGIPQQKRFFFGAPLENCSVSIVRYKNEYKMFYLHSFNDCSHLCG